MRKAFSKAGLIIWKNFSSESKTAKKAVLFVVPVHSNAFLVAMLDKQLAFTSTLITVLVQDFNMPTSYQKWVWEREADINWSELS